MPSERSGLGETVAQSYATSQPTKMAEISAGRREEEYQNNELRGLGETNLNLGFTCSSPSESFEQAEPEIEIKDANKSSK